MSLLARLHGLLTADDAALRGQGRELLEGAVSSAKNRARLLREAVDTRLLGSAHRAQMEHGTSGAVLSLALVSPDLAPYAAEVGQPYSPPGRPYGMTLLEVPGADLVEVGVVVRCGERLTTEARFSGFTVAVPDDVPGLGILLTGSRAWRVLGVPGEWQDAAEEVVFYLARLVREGVA